MPALETQCSVKFFNMLTPTVYEIGFESEPGFAFKAGQFISIVIPGAGPKGRDLRRAYSIASEPEKKPVELCIKLVEGGPGSTYLSKMRPGDRFRGFAPYGDFVYRTPPERHALFIATGTGIAPFRSMVFSDEYKKAPPRSATCLLGVRTEDELLYVKEFDRLSLNWVPIVSRPVGNWTGLKGRVTDYLRGLGTDYPWTQTEYYLCGNGEMITEVKSILADHGVPKEQVHQEKYY